ncbi:MAG: tail fiber protein [Lachnospiraceae bacterium]|nr:tail fiber protein [Lachnospiraceae bacterium]
MSKTQTLKIRHLVQDVPIGTIFIYSGSTDASSDEGRLNRATLLSQGYLPCDGTEVSVKDYQALYQIIHNYYGKPSNTSLFKLPDLRGVFLRGTDYTRGLDPDKNNRSYSGYTGASGNQVGSMQGDQLRSHNHFMGYLHKRSFLGANANDKPIKNCDGNDYRTGDAGGNETRPVNLNVNYIIKASYVVTEREVTISLD